jgi:hypothetical protein
VARLEQQALKSSIDPLYQQVKSYICCRVSNGVYDIWVAWTVAGVLGFLLAMMCSGRIAHHTLSMRKYQVGGWAWWRLGRWAPCVRERLLEQAAVLELTATRAFLLIAAAGGGGGCGGGQLPGSSRCRPGQGRTGA